MFGCENHPSENNSQSRCGFCLCIACGCTSSSRYQPKQFLKVLANLNQTQQNGESTRIPASAVVVSRSLEGWLPNQCLSGRKCPWSSGRGIGHMANDRSVPLAAAAGSEGAVPDSHSLGHPPLFLRSLARESVKKGMWEWTGDRRLKIRPLPLLAEQFVIPYTVFFKAACRNTCAGLLVC